MIMYRVNVKQCDNVKGVYGRDEPIENNRE